MINHRRPYLSTHCGFLKCGFLVLAWVLAWVLVLASSVLVLVLASSVLVLASSVLVLVLASSVLVLSSSVLVLVLASSVLVLVLASSVLVLSSSVLVLACSVLKFRIQWTRGWVHFVVPFTSPRQFSN